MMVHKGNKIYFQMTQKGIDAMTAALNNKGIKP
jgi:hypothetical protein